MYTGLRSSIRINEHLTDWFSIEKGVRQGDNLAPTLFAIFINDLVPEINCLNCGISLENDFSISTLFYADDIVLMSGSEEGLQRQLNALNKWSTKWSLNVNIDKTKILHVRRASVSRSN